MGSALHLAPAPDFRYVGLQRLEPNAARRFGVAAAVFGIGAGMTLAMHGLAPSHAVGAGLLAGLTSALCLRTFGTVSSGGFSTTSRCALRMAIVPWGVIVDIDEAPRILRWAALKNVEIVVVRGLRRLTRATPSSRVIVETERDCFVGEAVGDVPLERLVVHLAEYATEQASPLALDLLGDTTSPRLEASEPSCEALLAAARDWVFTAAAARTLGLGASGYRHTAALVPTPPALAALRGVLRDREPRPSDPRAFAALVAAELRAVDLSPELVALTQCPHPVVAAIAKQAARKLGVPRARTGALEEVAPFLFDADRLRLEAWLRE